MLVILLLQQRMKMTCKIRYWLKRVGAKVGNWSWLIQATKVVSWYRYLSIKLQVCEKENVFCLIFNTTNISRTIMSALYVLCVIIHPPIYLPHDPRLRNTRIPSSLFKVYMVFYFHYCHWNINCVLHDVSVYDISFSLLSLKHKLCPRTQFVFQWQ